MNDLLKQIIANQVVINAKLKQIMSNTKGDISIRASIKELAKHQQGIVELLD